MTFFLMRVSDESKNCMIFSTSQPSRTAGVSAVVPAQRRGSKDSRQDKKRYCSFTSLEVNRCRMESTAEIRDDFCIALTASHGEAESRANAPYNKAGDRIKQMSSSY